MDKIYEFFLELYATLFGRPCFIRFNRFIFNLSIRGMGIQNYRNFRQTGEEKLIDVFSKLTKHNNNLVVFDIGANRGEYSSLVLDHNKNRSMKVYAFEPGHVVFNELHRNLSSYNNIVLFNVACGSKNGYKMFYYNTNSSFSSFYSKSPKQERVTMVKLDSIVKKSNIKNINLLKLDTEGSEMDILIGAKNLIRNKKIDILQFEFNSMNVRSRSFLKDFIDLLDGYFIYRLLPNGVIKMNNYDPLYWEIFSFQNIVAVKKNLAKDFEKIYEE